MRPTLRQLEYIVTVARLGGFGLAADALNVSQPSLSAQIAEVERDFGARIFDRGRAGAHPTPLGEDIVRRAQRILAQVEDLRSVARDGAAKPFGGRLRLGVLPSIGPYLLPPVVTALHASHPELRILIREESTWTLEQGLRQGRFDMIISTPEDHPNTRQERLCLEHLLVAVARDDVLAEGHGPVTASELRGRIFLTLDRGHRLSRIVYALASDCEGLVSEEYEGTSLDSIRMMAASGAGVAILPELYARRQVHESTEVVIRPLALAQATRVIALLQPADSPALAGTELLSEALRHELRRAGLVPEDATL